MKQAIWLLLLLLPYSIRCQDYIAYQGYFNRIDDDVQKQQLQQSVFRLDTVYSNYSFVFAKHCVKALQVCVVQHDSIRAALWLQKCFEQGVPLWVIRSGTFTKPALHYTCTQPVLLRYDSFHQAYLNRIDHRTAHLIDSLITLDQFRTRRVNDGFIPLRYTVYGLQWLRNNKRQFRILDTLIHNHGYPGEQMIGLPLDLDDSASTIRRFMHFGPNILQERRAFTMLLHCYSHRCKDLRSVLRPNVTNGMLTSWQYASICDFIAEYGHQSQPEYYNAWHDDNDAAHAVTINIRRSGIGLNSTSEEQRNSRLSMQRSGSKTANDFIMME